MPGAARCASTWPPYMSTSPRTSESPKPPCARLGSIALLAPAPVRERQREGVAEALGLGLTPIIVVAVDRQVALVDHDPGLIARADGDALALDGLAAEELAVAPPRRVPGL